MLWKNEYILGHPSIDAEHKMLLDRMDPIIEKLLQKDELAAKTECIKFIRGFKISGPKHFATEEAYMQEMKYESLPLHKKQHEDFMNTILQYEIDFQSRAQDDKLIKNFAATLLTWIVYHVQNIDRKYMTGEPIEVANGSTEFTQILHQAVVETFHNMFLEDIMKINETIFNTHLHGNYFATLHFQGVVDSYVVFSFPAEMVYKMICYIINMNKINLDKDLMNFSINKIINAIGSKASFQLSTNIKTCSVSKPQITMNTFDTTVSNFSAGKTLHYQSSMGNFDILFTVS